MTVLPRTDVQRSTAHRNASADAMGLSWPVVFYLIAVVTPINASLGPIFLTSVRAVLLVMIVPMLMRLFSGKLGRLLLVDIFFMIFVAWGVLAFAITSPSQAISQGGSVGLEFFGGYLMGRIYISDRNSFISLCKFLVVLVVISAPFALYETFTGKPIISDFFNKIPGLYSNPNVMAEKRMGFERVQYTFVHPIHYGLFCSVAFSLCFVALKDVYTPSRRFLSSMVIMLTGFLSLSSGALLAIVLQIFLIGWYLALAPIKYRWWLLVGLFLLAYLTIDLLSNRAPIYVFMSYATFSAHNAYWRSIIFDWGMKNILGDVIENIPASPWVGIGLNDWIRPSYMHSGSMDNFWLVIAVRYGIPGLVFLLIGYVSAIFRVMRRNFEGNSYLLQIRRGWVFTFLGLSFTLSTVFVWTNIYSFVFFIFGAGIWLITVDSEDSEEAARPKEPLSTDQMLRAQYTRFPQIQPSLIRPKGL
jgi:hypothetical protein